MVVHLSPKAKALTLPLNWSQFLKTLIGAENYTLFQLPPHKTGVRPSSFTRSRYTLLPLVFSSFARFLPLGYFFFRHEQSFEISRLRGDEHRERVEFLLRDTLWDRSTNYGMKCRSFTKWSFCQHHTNISPGLWQSSCMWQVGLAVAQKVISLDVCLKRNLAVTLLTSSSSPVAWRERLRRCPIKSNSSVRGFLPSPI